MGTTQRPSHASSSWLRRAGTGAFQRTTGAIPDTLRRRQHAGRLSHDPGAVLPRAAPADEERPAQACDCDYAEVAAAPSARDFDARGADFGAIRAGAG